MICDSCGKEGAHLRRTTRVYGRGRSMYMVENVPVVSCRTCGESYVTARTLKELDRIHEQWRKFPKRLVPVVKFGRDRQPGRGSQT